MATATKKQVISVSRCHVPSMIPYFVCALGCHRSIPCQNLGWRYCRNDRHHNHLVSLWSLPSFLFSFHHLLFRFSLYVNLFHALRRSTRMWIQESLCFFITMSWLTFFFPFSLQSVGFREDAFAESKQGSCECIRSNIFQCVAKCCFDSEASSSIQGTNWRLPEDRGIGGLQRALFRFCFIDY